jgi:hypothetical protein
MRVNDQVWELMADRLADGLTTVLDWFDESQYPEARKALADYWKLLEILKTRKTVT